MTALRPASPIAPADVDAVVAVLRSGWLSTGPRNLELEAAVAGRLEHRDGRTPVPQTDDLDRVGVGATGIPGLRQHRLALPDQCEQVAGEG